MSRTKIIKHSLTPYNLGFQKMRIGPNFDGGYVLYKEFLDATKLVYSLGVGWVWGADLELANMGKQVRMYDITPFNFTHPNMKFHQVWVDSNLLNQELEKVEDTNLLLCMDIEGSEYEVLTNIEEKNLLKFSQLSFELHSVTTKNMEELMTVLNRVNNAFTMFHIHGNNCGTISDGLPETVELSFLRNDLCIKGKKIENIQYPIPGVDYPNNHSSKDYTLDWWIS